jgi:hypothetical protein
LLSSPGVFLNLETKMKSKEQDDADANRDPISGAPGAHPIGTGLGAAAGGMAAGAAAGTVLGPAGTLAGAAAGAIVGGLVGKGVGEAVDPTEEDVFWAKQYEHEPYFEQGYTYADYQPAYRAGYEGRMRYHDRKFSEAEGDIRREYEQSNVRSRLGWDKARLASQAAWNRVERAIPGDSDRDGR